jgi:hypothetical protein
MILIVFRNSALVIATTLLLMVVGREIILEGLKLWGLTGEFSACIANGIVGVLASSFLFPAANDDEFVEWARKNSLGEEHADFEIYSDMVSAMQNHGRVLETGHGEDRN